METFGEWVRLQRDGRRLTRSEFAQRVGCSVAMLRKIETDERRPSEQIARLIASAFEIPPADHPTLVRVARGELGTNRLPARSREPAPPISGADAPRALTKFPIFPTPLIGRRDQLAVLKSLLRDPHCRLLSLVGAGGIGKTRLACELALEFRDDFRDGVWFVPLASVNSLRLLVPAVADAMAFTFQSAGAPDPKDELFNHLQGRQALLLLDNVEQLLGDPGIEILTELVARAQATKLLVTSREALNLEHEQVFQLGGLPIPVEAGDPDLARDTSVELFLQRARRANAGFEAGPRDFPAIVRICRLVDGMPLAIELAAGWARSLTCDEIAHELERGLDLLSTGARDVPSRHRSMQAVFDHSWGLLSKDQQGALARLSVFRGGFDREAAWQVAGASIQMLSSLVSKSLVLRTTSGRYDLHELVRQFAAQRLQAGPGASGGAQAQHLSFYLTLAETAAAQRKGPGQTEWLGRLAREYDNVRAALERSLADGGQQIGGLPDAGLRLVAALPWFWRVRGHFQEGRRWSLKALGRDPNGIPAPSQAPQVADPGSGGANRRREHARVLYGLALLENAMGEHEAARSSAEESARIHRELGDTQGLAEALSILGQALLWMGESAEGHSSLEEALALFRETGDRWNVAVCLFRIGTDLADYKADRRGLGMLEECAGILDELGDRLLYGSLLLALGLIATNEGDYASAASHFDRSLAIAREMGNPWDIANALTNIGCLLRIQGDYAAAGAHFEEALQMYRDRGSGTWSADPLCALAENHISQGHLAQAREKLAEAASFGQPSGNRWLEVLVGYFDGLLHYHEGDMSAATARLERTAALARASQYKPDLARALVTLGRTFSAEGEAGKALATIVEGLNIFWESGYRLGAATALEALAAISPEEVPEQAARLLGAAAAIRRSLGAPLPPVDRASHEGLTARVRKRLGDSAFSTAWAHGTEDVLDDLVVEVIRAFRSPSGGPAAGEPPVAGVPPRPQTALGST